MFSRPPGEFSLTSAGTKNPGQVTANPVPCGQDIAATGFLTSYSYDPLGNQLSVTQGSLNPRTWSYDSLSRQLTSVNPESGTATYTYDVNSNVSSKVTPKQNQTNPSVTVSATNQFDVTNRIVKKAYSDGTTPTENFWYDSCPASGCPSGFTLTNAVGRVVETFTSNTGEFESYDPMGRTVSDYQCTPQNCGSSAFPLNYAYDLLGDLASSTNGFGVTITNTFNSVGQLTGVGSSLVDANHPATFLSGAVYLGTGQFSTAARWGIIGAASSMMFEAAAYDTRLRLIAFGEQYNPVHGTHSEKAYNFSCAYAPNGAVISVDDFANGTWNYTYDDFNRLLSATKTTGLAPLAYSNVYDRYGNRWDQQLGGVCTGGTTFCISFDSNNHVNNGTLTYDAAGNVLSDSAHHYTYDAENRLISVDAGSTAIYVYDALGRRARKTTSGLSVDYLYDLSNRPVTQVSVPPSGVGTWTTSEVFSGTRHLATYAGGSGGTTYATISDPLVGTERTRLTSASICEQIASLPFGDGLTTSGTCGDPSPLHFAGKERDTESGLDNFGARYNASSLGRFMSPDWSANPESVPYADLTDPQSLNLYTYVSNNPVSRRDANGHVTCAPDTWNPATNTLTAGSCNFDFSDLTTGMAAVGHHFFPKAIWQEVNSASKAYRVLNQTVTGALKKPKLSNSFNKLHRSLNKQAEKILEDTERRLGKSVEDFDKRDWQELGNDFESAGGDVQAFNQRLASLEPDARTFGEALADTLEEVFPAAAEATVATVDAGVALGAEGVE